MLQGAVLFVLNRQPFPSIRGVNILELSSCSLDKNFISSLTLSAKTQDVDFTAVPTAMAFSIHKNINLPWLAVTGLAVWFLFIHTPTFWMNRKLLTRDVLLAIHIITASTIYLSCAHNCVFTPSFTNMFGKSSKFMHVWVGRVGMVSGIISFSLGAFLAWSRLGLDTVGGTTLSFTLPITIGGIAQLCAQYNGYVAIRQYKSLGREISNKLRQIKDISVSNEQKEFFMEEHNLLKISQRKALRRHIGNMISLFVSACGIPAGIRLVEFMTGGSDGVATIFAILSMIGVLSLIGTLYMNMMMPDVSGESEISLHDGYGTQALVPPT